MGTGTSFRIRITMGTGMGKGTTSLVENFEKLGYRFVHEGRLCRISFLSVTCTPIVHTK